jgi:hypothetical protein
MLGSGGLGLTNSRFIALLCLIISRKKLCCLERNGKNTSDPILRDRTERLKMSSLTGLVLLTRGGWPGVCGSGLFDSQRLQGGFFYLK